MESFVNSIIKLLFPALCDKSAKNLRELEQNVLKLKSQLLVILDCLREELAVEINQTQVVDQFFENLFLIEKEMEQDAEFILAEDPAAKSLNEVIICYPGFYASAVYRIAHYFFKLGIPLFPRILTEYSHRRTGIDIHPGAQIGSPFYIDHGTGVVIGETSVIGKRVKIYQGVTLGATTVAKDMVGKKRHPTIEDDVVIYANATILGGETIIGKKAIIGGSSWIMESVEENARVFFKK